MELTDEMIAQANQRGAEARKSTPVATGARYDKRIGRVVIVLSSGLELAFAPHLAQGLETAKPSDLQEIEISPSGLGLHFPKLDADLYLPAMLEGLLGSASWVASRMGAKGGKAKSAAKTAAVRANGAKGGRPRKQVPASA
ncbi:MAG: DUF2442 domain-containing protein [Aeromonas sp.]